MPEITWESSIQFLDCYTSVTALYLSFKNSPKPHVVRRAELRQGKVQPLPIDFLCDVELKAKRALTPEDCKVFAQCMASGKTQDVPKLTQLLLGDAWFRHDMDIDGHYKALYFRAKQDTMRDREEPVHFVEEEVNAEEILEAP